MKQDSAGGGTVRTSTILISAGRKLSVYRKLDEVPPGLRSKLVKSTAGANAGTVLIADRRGAQELLRENVRSLLERRHARARQGIVPQLREDAHDTLRFLVVHWKSVGAAGALSALLWWVIALLRA